MENIIKLEYVFDDLRRLLNQNIIEISCISFNNKKSYQTNLLYIK